MSSLIPENPYAISAGSMAAAINPDADSDVDSIRKKYLSHEASVKSIGLLYWLGGIFLALMSIGYFVAGMIALANSQSIGPGIFLSLLALFFGSFAVFQIFVAQAIGKLKPWSRIASTVISCIGLLGFPLGTLINGYFLYLLQSKKGEYIFSQEYQQVIAATPHIKYKTSIIVWILLGLLVGLLCVGIVAALVGRA